MASFDENIDDNPGAKAQLLEAACQIMRSGYTINLSLSELSLRSGLNSALVKYYFGNKNGLMLALLERDMANVTSELQALVVKDMDPEKKLRRHIGAVIDTYASYPYLNRLLMQMIRDSSPKEAKRVADLYLLPLSKAYDSLIEEGVKAGKFRAVDPRLFYLTVTGAADRFFDARQIMLHCYGRQEESSAMRDAYREQTIDILMRGLLA